MTKIEPYENDTCPLPENVISTESRSLLACEQSGRLATASFEHREFAT